VVAIVLATKDLAFLETLEEFLNKDYLMMIRFRPFPMQGKTKE
jgi:hypothetical protein